VPLQINRGQNPVGQGKQGLAHLFRLAAKGRHRPVVVHIAIGKVDGHRPRFQKFAHVSQQAPIAPK
jgi:hypothetical protein